MAAALLSRKDERNDQRDDTGGKRPHEHRSTHRELEDRFFLGIPQKNKKNGFFRFWKTDFVRSNFFILFILEVR